MSNDAGKGSLQRPFDRERYAANYERIFGKKRKKKNTVTIGGMEIEYVSEFPKEDNNIYARNIRPEDYPLPKNETCVMINPKSESCQFCKRNPDAVEIQTRFFCPEKGEPLDG